MTSDPQSTSDAPESASISFAIAAIPAQPLFGDVSKASLAITKLVENQNIIDNDRFPSHVSLILAGTTATGMQWLADALSAEDFSNGVRAHAVSIYTNPSGLIAVDFDGDTLLRLHERVMNLTERLLQRDPVVRPHLKTRWPRLSSDEQASVKRFGSYHVGRRFRPHISVAQVDSEDLRDMAAVARRHIQLPQEVNFSEIQLVDVGHRNEQWKVEHRVVINP